MSSNDPNFTSSLDHAHARFPKHPLPLAFRPPPAKRAKFESTALATPLKSVPVINTITPWNAKKEENPTSVDWDFNGHVMTTFDNGTAIRKYEPPRPTSFGSLISNPGQINAAEQILNGCYDIVHVLFENMDEVTATCLALSSPDLYFLYKRVFKTPVGLDSMIYLDHDEGHGGEFRRLHDLIKNWSGLRSSHRLVLWPEKRGPGLVAPPMFLNCDIYGRVEDSQEERELRQRWVLYKASPVHRYSPLGPEDPNYDGQKMLPSPFGRGRDWYSVAAAVEDVPKELRSEIAEQMMWSLLRDGGVPGGQDIELE